MPIEAQQHSLRQRWTNEEDEALRELGDRRERELTAWRQNRSKEPLTWEDIAQQSGRSKHAVRVRYSKNLKGSRQMDSTFNNSHSVQEQPARDVDTPGRNLVDVISTTPPTDSREPPSSPPGALAGGTVNTGSSASRSLPSDNSVEQRTEISQRRVSQSVRPDRECRTRGVERTRQVLSSIVPLLEENDDCQRPQRSPTNNPQSARGVAGWSRPNVAPTAPMSAVQHIPQEQQRVDPDRLSLEDLRREHAQLEHDERLREDRHTADATVVEKARLVKEIVAMKRKAREDEQQEASRREKRQRAQLTLDTYRDEIADLMV